MTETDYFKALKDLIDAKLHKVPTGTGDAYQIKEFKQEKFDLTTIKLSRHFVIQLEKMLVTDWTCFKPKHKYAHKRCDCIVVSWDKKANIPQYLLIELKSQRANNARLQLQASLAFCHFVHRMICVNTAKVPNAKFAAITVIKLPFVDKSLSPGRNTFDWSNPPLRPDCNHMSYNRSCGSLPLAQVFCQF